MATTEKTTQELQELIDQCDTDKGECIPCLELLRRIDEDLAFLDAEAARIRRRRWTIAALVLLATVTVAAVVLLIYR